MCNKNKIIVIFSFVICAFYTQYAICHKMQYYIKTIQILKIKLDQQQDKDVHVILGEIQDTLESLYKKMVEVVAVHYCDSQMFNVNFMYDRLIVEIGHDLLKLIKLFISYIPMLYKSKTLSKIEKCKQLIYIGSVLAVLIMWLQRYWNKDLLHHSVSVEYRPRPVLRY